MSETKDAQEWLKNKYENKDKLEKIEFEVNEKVLIDGKEYIFTELKGNLEIDGYSQLEKIDLRGGKKLTKIIIKNCNKVKEIRVYDNEITEIEGLKQLVELTHLSLAKNQINGIIDVSKNTKLEYLNLQGNSDTAKIEGWEKLTSLRFLNGGFVGQDKSIYLDFTEIIKKVLKEMAEELKLNVDGKTPEEMKQIIKDEAAKIEQNKIKLNEKLPGLLDQTAKVNDEKLEEIKNNVEEGEEHQKLVTGNPDLVTEDGKKIDQKKIDGLKDSNKDGADAITRLGVNDLKVPTLEDKLGEGKSLSDIPTTLKDLLEENKKLEKVIKEELGYDYYAQIEVDSNAQKPSFNKPNETPPPSGGKNK